MEIRLDDLSSDAIVQFLRDHVDEMRRITPPGSAHALDLDGLRASEITFWSVWDRDELVGCGALKALDAHSGEIKSMRTTESHRRRGVASAMLTHIVDEATRRGYARLYLETGSFTAFDAARAFYARHGFEPCEPFADYADDPNSSFMARVL